MEPEDQGLETSEIVLLPEDQSENHSSISDIIHLEAELHGRVESDDEEAGLQSSMLSMIGSDKELEEMRAETGASLDFGPPAEPDLHPPETVELLMCVEDPMVEEMEVEDASQQPVFTHIPLLSDPSDFTLTSVPISEIISQVLEYLPPPQEVHQTPPPTHSHSEAARTLESQSINTASSEAQHHTVSPSEGAQKAEAEPVTSATPDASPFELPVLLIGGAALVAVVGVLTYTLSRK